jgi:hypothetical protein
LENNRQILNGFSLYQQGKLCNSATNINPNSSFRGASTSTMQIRLNRNVAAGRREHQYSQQSRAKSSHGQLGKNLVISGSSKTFIPASASKQKQHASAMQAHLVPHDKAHVSQFQHFNQHRLISKEMVKQQ